MKAIRAVINALLEAGLLNFVPKGYLTKASSVLQILVGVGILAGAVNTAIQTGTFPDIQLPEVLGILLLGNGAQGAGLHRQGEGD